MIEFTFYFKSFICLPQYEDFLAIIFCNFFLVLLNKIQPISKRRKENIKMKPWKIGSLTDLSGDNIGFH